MKIIFDSEEQKSMIIRNLSKDKGCPSRYGMTEIEICADYDNCTDCWEDAIECEVKK